MSFDTKTAWNFFFTHQNNKILPSSKVLSVFHKLTTANVWNPQQQAMWQPTLVYTIGPIVLVLVWYYNSVVIVCPSKCILYIQLTQPSTQKGYYVQTLFVFNFWGSLYLVSFPIKLKLNTIQWAGHKASVLSCMHALIGHRFQHWF